MRRNCFFRTASGKLMDILNPKPEDFDIQDIAQSLAQTCRYNGHTNRFYSVAEHCWHLSYIVPPEFALQALMHENDEPYIGDIVGPVRELTWIMSDDCVESGERIEEISYRLVMSSFQKFNVLYGVTLIASVVSAFDYQIRINETRVLYNHNEFKLPGEPIEYDINKRFDLSTPEVARVAFLERFIELGGRA